MTDKPPRLPREFKLGVTASFLSGVLVCVGSYFIIPERHSYQERGSGYSVDYRKSGKAVSVTFKLEEALKNEAEKLSGLSVRVQETGVSAPLTRKDDSYFASLSAPDAYTLLILGKNSDGKEVPLKSFRYPPAK